MAEADVPTDRPVLLFDGVCNLCNGLVQWVIERDPDAEFRFAALQSDAGQALRERLDLPTDEFETFVIVDGEEYPTKSTAALRVLRRLGLAYSILYPLVVVPRLVRDRVYDVVAAHRYGWFGRRESCRRPTPAREARFLGATGPGGTGSTDRAAGSDDGAAAAADPSNPEPPS
jgi:predicted DCC family thiol-disulfide oxidoreductase YuxK